MLFRRQGSAWLDGASTVGGPPVRVRHLGEWVGGGVVYDDTDDTTVDFIWTGAQSEDGIVVSTKLAVPDGAMARLAVSPHEDFSADVRFGPDAEVTDGLIKLSADGLDADAQYHCAIRVKDTVYLKKLGRFRTLPASGTVKSFALAFASCSKISFGAISFERMLAREPLAMVHLGDWVYSDYAGTDSAVWIGGMHAAFDDAARAQFHREIPTYYMWDDHDFGPDDSSGYNANGVPNAYRQPRLNDYRAIVPHPPLADPASDASPYYAVDIGRARLVVTDTRSSRIHKTATDNASKTMLGAAQKAWLKTQFDWLASNPERAMIWAQTMPWIGTGSSTADHWAGYSTERQELVDYLTGVTGPADVSGRIVMLSGDAHMLAYDDGSNAPGGIRVCHAAPLGQNTSTKGGPYSGGTVRASTTQYGMLQVTDDGENLICNFRGYRSDTDAEVITSGEFALIGSIPDTTPPEILTGDTQAGTADADWSITLTADEPVTWSIIGGADAALFGLDGAILSLPGQPVGSYVVTIRATDAADNASEKTLTITIAEASTGSPEIVNTSTNGYSGAASGGNTSGSVPIPWAVTAGNMLVAFMAPDKSSGAIATPAGWTRIMAHEAGPEQSGAVFYKISDGSETSFETTWGNSRHWAGAVVELSGVSTVALSELDTSFVSTATTSLAMLSSATAPSGAMLIAALAVDSAPDPWGLLTSWSNDFEEAALAPGFGKFPGLSVSAKLADSAAPISTTATWNVTDQALGFMLALT